MLHLTCDRVPWPWVSRYDYCSPDKTQGTGPHTPGLLVKSLLLRGPTLQRLATCIDRYGLDAAIPCLVSGDSGSRIDYGPGKSDSLHIYYPLNHSLPPATHSVEVSRLDIGLHVYKCLSVAEGVHFSACFQFIWLRLRCLGAILCCTPWCVVILCMGKYLGSSVIDRGDPWYSPIECTPANAPSHARDTRMKSRFPLEIRVPFFEPSKLRRRRSCS